MINLTGQWIGNTYGTHPSNIFAEFINSNNTISVSIRSAAPNSQDVKIFIGICTQHEGLIEINLTQSIDGYFTTTTGKVIFKIVSERVLEGDFELSIGAKGIIKISKYYHFNTLNERSEPLQIIAKEYLLNYPLKIYKNDILKIIEVMKELSTKTGNLVITEQSKGTKVTKYADDYLKTIPHQNNIDSLSFTAQVLVSGFTNTLTLNLNRRSTSNIISQSPDYLWSHSTPTFLKETLEQRANKLLGIYKKYDLEINGLLFLALLVILPSFEIRIRLVWTLAFLTFFISHFIFYSKVSQTVIYANTDEP